MFFFVYCDKLTLLSLMCDTHEMNIQRQTRLYRTSYISKYLLRSLGLRYIRVLLYILIYNNHNEHFEICQMDPFMSTNIANKHYCIPRTKYVRGILWFSRRYASATYINVDWYRWEDSWEARLARFDYLWAVQGPPNSQKYTFLYIVAHIWKTVSYFFPLLYICLLCDEVLLPWNFRSPGFDVRAPPNMKKKYIFFIFWV